MDASHRHKLVLETICDPSSQRRLGRARHYLAQDVRKKVPDGETLSDMELMETVWALVSQGLAYIDFTEPAAENWKLLPTPAGQAVLADTHASPDDPAGYWARLVRSAPKASDIVQLYAREALDAYNHCLYQASAVMLGVASEAAVLEVARVLAAYLPAAQGEKLHKVLDSPTRAMSRSLTDLVVSWLVSNCQSSCVGMSISC